MQEYVDGCSNRRGFADEQKRVIVRETEKSGITRDPILNGRSVSDSALALLKAVAAVDHQQGAVDVAGAF
ncbi:hypothetical protein GCM10007881_26520 [Mesorhizobium huakuii]|nr:hypothetical protein GCM10007881_26520 [Mesorhizobium huakuii]